MILDLLLSVHLLTIYCGHHLVSYRCNGSSQEPRCFQRRKSQAEAHFSQLVVAAEAEQQLGSGIRLDQCR